MTHLLSKVVRQTRLIALYGLTALVGAGVCLSVLGNRNEVSPILSGANTPKVSGVSGLINHGSLYGDCEKVEGGYDCTDRATREKVYEAAKKGIKWYTNPETNLEKLSAVCEKQGINDTDCPLILKAISTQESYFGKVMVGDGGRSEGYFHILNIHNLSSTCKRDLVCSSTWTLKRLVHNGFLIPSKKWWAVGTHNSYTPEINKRYAGEVKAKFEHLLASK